MVNLQVIKEHEGYSSKAYQDVVGIWTIGYGNTFWEDGTSVKPGETITQERAEKLLLKVVQDFKGRIEEYVKVPLTDNQWDAIISFAYNVGVGAFKTSSLLRKLNVNPNDPAIRDEFMKWINAGGKRIQGLINRRKQEADLYFKPIKK